MEIYNPLILLTTRADVEILGRKTKKDNISTIGWHTAVSSKPGLYAVVLHKDIFSYKMIKESGVFCVNFITDKLKKQALFCGSYSGEHMDKFKETNLTKEECSKIDCPAIKEGSKHLECEVINEVETGDHIMVLGKVLNIMDHKKRQKEVK